MRKLVTVFTIIAFLAGCSGLPFAPVQQESLSQHLDKVKSNLSALPADIVHSPNPLWTALTSTDLLGVCMVADIATTAVALNSGKFVEANPVLKPFIGPHNFVPLILVSALIWYAVWRYNEPKLTAFANVIKCGVVAHNLFVIHGAGIMH